MTDDSTCYIGVDVGGTHTDVAVVSGMRIARGKALTTYDDFSRGLLEAVEVAAAELGTEMRSLLQNTDLFVNATTVVTNAITQLRGARVGVIVTSGFADEFHFGGGPRQATYDDHLQENVPIVLDRDAIVEIDERIDYLGDELVRLDEQQVLDAADRLVELGVEAIAVCFLSSHLNDAHEQRARELISERYPSPFVTLSSEVFPVAGETRRWMTAVFNSFVQASAQQYLDTISERVREAGYEGVVAFFQGLGGAATKQRLERFPLALLAAGPAGGAIGARELGAEMGVENVLIGDMGGTSFDTGLIHGGELRIEKNLQIGPFQTGVNVVSVVSVGAGGGSVAWISERGVPQVGPLSAGSTPGPACYDRGGTEPTVTDAMVVLGMIDPANYLGGRVRLNVDASRVAVATIGDPLGWTVDETAAAIHDLVIVNMATAVREVSVEKGYDPRDFMFLTYGGTLPLFAAQIAEHLGITKVVIPDNSSVFCARGVLASDFKLRLDQAVGWNLEDRIGVSRVNVAAERLAATAAAEMALQGFDASNTITRFSADLRFLGQVFELSLPLELPLHADHAEELLARFLEQYEKTYGAGTAWKSVSAELVNVSVTATGVREKPPLQISELVPTSVDIMTKATRSIFLPMTKSVETVRILDEAKMSAGSEVAGPAIIDARDTTIFVPPDIVARRDEYRNFVLELDPT